MFNFNIENKPVAFAFSKQPIAFFATSVFGFSLLYLLFILAREIVISVFGARWYVIGEWSWSYTVEVFGWIFVFANIALAVHIKWRIKVWWLRRQVVVDDDSIADFSPRKAITRKNFSERTKEAVIKRTMRECGGKLLCFYSRKEACFENQINLDGFTPDDEVHFDHVVPPQYGGDDSPENCVIARRKVNLSKHDDIKPPYDKPLLEWLKRHGKTIHRDCLTQ